MSETVAQSLVQGLLSSSSSSRRQAHLIESKASYLRASNWGEVKAAGLLDTMLNLPFEDARGRVDVRARLTYTWTSRTDSADRKVGSHGVTFYCTGLPE